jgi:Fur family transcriptional regulator, ferric uptake regulator
MNKCEKIHNSPESILRQNGQRVTQSRAAILAALIEADRPMTPEQICTAIDHDINKVTVYRNLEIFVDADIVHKAFVQERSWHYELADHCSSQQCHPHFRCVNCGKNHCFKNARLPMFEPCEPGFVIKHQKVQIEGLCPNCSVKLENNNITV